jgi:hypothetical protein
MNSYFYFQKAVNQEGATWFSAAKDDYQTVKLREACHIATAIIHENEQGHIRYEGDLWLDVDKYIESAIAATQAIAKLLEADFRVNLNQCELFASGGKGFHIRIPAKLLSAPPLAELPKVYKKLAAKIDELVGGDSGIDFQLYNMGKGKLIRVENKQRLDGAYKVPMTWQELEYLTPEIYSELTAQPRQNYPVEKPEPNQALSTLFCEALSEVEQETKDKKFETTPPEAFESLGNINLPCKLQIMAGLDTTKKQNACNNSKAQTMALLQDLDLASDDDVAEYARNNVTDSNSESDLLNHVKSARNPANTKEFSCGLMLHETGVTKSACESCPVNALNASQHEEPNTTLIDDVISEGEVNLLKHLDDSHIMKKLPLAIARTTGLPASTAFLMGIGAFSSMAVRYRRVAYQFGGSVPIGINAVAEHPPGGGKTRCLKTYTAPFQKAYQNHRDNCLNELKRLDKKDTERKELLEEALAVTFMITNSTPEALEASLESTCGFFAGVSSEKGLANSLLGLSYGDQRANNNDLMLNGFDGGYMATLRVSRTGYSGFVGGAVVIFAQEGTVKIIVTQSNASGLSERFLMLSQPHNIGKRDFLNVPSIPQEYLNQYAEACNNFASVIFDKPKPLKELPALKIPAEGWNLINEFRNKIEPMQANGGCLSHESLRGAASKVDIQIMKIAANLHLMTSQALEIDLNHVISAIGIVDDLLQEHRKLLEDNGFTGVKAEFQAIIHYLSKGTKSAGAVEICQALRNVTPFKSLSSSKTDAIKAALKTMVGEKLLTEVNGKYTLK